MVDEVKTMSAVDVEEMLQTASALSETDPKKSDALYRQIIDGSNMKLTKDEETKLQEQAMTGEYVDVVWKRKITSKLLARIVSAEFSSPSSFILLCGPISHLHQRLGLQVFDRMDIPFHRSLVSMKV